MGQQISRADALAQLNEIERGKLSQLGKYLRSLFLGDVASKLEIEAGRGILAGTGTVYRSRVDRRGGIIRTSILLDLTGLAGSATDLDVIGTGTSAAHIGQINKGLCGTILGGSMTCLEVPVGGPDDIDLYYATVGTAVYDDGIAALVETALITEGSAWTLNQSIGIADPAGLAGNYLYLTNGEAAAGGTYTAGKFLIELLGYDA